jgi:N6-L-threonylcarbamoyladenine synthase
MKILAIETSCDETSVAVVDDNRLLAQSTYSQIKHHQAFGGVNPGVARRNHEQRLPLLLKRTLKRVCMALPGYETCNCALCIASRRSSLVKRLTSIDAIAVTVGPGLPPALEVGLRTAKEVAMQHQMPLIPVNHLEGHIASVFLARSTGVPYVKNAEKLQFPFLSLIVSGGHTELIITSKQKLDDADTLSKSALSSRTDLATARSQTVEGLHTTYIIAHALLGQTLDDAAGEVIDKVGRELGLGYPAGPVVEAMAKLGNSNALSFPLPLKNTPQDDLNFSFSGLKTKAVQMLVGDHRIGTYTDRVRGAEFAVESSGDVLNPEPRTPNLELRTPNSIQDFSASFQQAVINALIFKVKRAVAVTGIKQLVLTGGVSANLALRKQLRSEMKKMGGQLFAAPKNFTGDNAGMIGLAAHMAYARGEYATTPEEINALDRKPNLQFVSSCVTP